MKILLAAVSIQCRSFNKRIRGCGYIKRTPKIEKATKNYSGKLAIKLYTYIVIKRITFILARYTFSSTKRTKKHYLYHKIMLRTNNTLDSNAYIMTCLMIINKRTFILKSINTSIHIIYLYQLFANIFLLDLLHCPPFYVMQCDII